MMKGTVIFDGQRVAVNGVTRYPVSLPQHDANWRVLQWDSDGLRKNFYGRMEVHKGEPFWISDAKFFQPYLEAWEAWKPRPAPDDEPVRLTNREKLDVYTGQDVALRALIRVVAKRFGMTEQQLMAEMESELPSDEETLAFLRDLEAQERERLGKTRR